MWIYREAGRGRRNKLQNKYIALGNANIIQQQWGNRETEQGAEQLQKRADNMNMTPIWNYAKKMRKIGTNKRFPPRKTRLGENQRPKRNNATMDRVYKKQLYITEDRLETDIHYIPEIYLRDSKIRAPNPKQAKYIQIFSAYEKTIS